MLDPFNYTPPKVWSWATPSGSTFANIDRPIVGPTHEKQLPNGVKVTIMLEELIVLGASGPNMMYACLKSATAISSAAACGIERCSRQLPDGDIPSAVALPIQ